MKQKLIASGLALSLLFSGATYSSASVKPLPVTEIQLTVVDSDDNVDAKFWSEIGDAALWLIGLQKVASDPGHRNAVGKGSTNDIFQYEEVIEVFDN